MTPLTRLVAMLKNATVVPSPLMTASNEAALASVVWSGNKSMHAYWYANQDEEVNLTFMKEAVCLGADYHGWTACQFARIPNPGKPYFQEILYLDPLR